MATPIRTVGKRMRIRADKASLLEWLDEDGAVFDEGVELLEMSGGNLRFGALVGGAGPSYWNDREKFVKHWRSREERLDVFEIRADGAKSKGRATLPRTVDEVKLGRSGLVFRVGGMQVSLSGDAYEITKTGRLVRDKLCRSDRSCFSFFGSARLVARDLSRAGDVWQDWKGSGQPFGSAFVESTAPARVKKNAELDGAWLITAHGEPAVPERGVWIAGRSLRGSYHASVTRTRADDQLFFTVLTAVASLPGIDVATSGGTLFERSELAAWLATKLEA